MSENKMTNEQKYKEVLEEISHYTLPVYTKEDGKKYVPLEFATELRNMAKEALK